MTSNSLLMRPRVCYSDGSVVPSVIFAGVMLFKDIFTQKCSGFDKRGKWAGIEYALKTRMDMKGLAIIRVLCVLLGSLSFASGAWQDDYDSLLKKYATPEGVRYKAWKANSTDVSKLNSISDAIAKESLSGKSRDQKLAFYLNAYNVGIIKTAIEKYPVKSLKSSEWGFFKKDRFVVAGKKVSFDDIEHGTIRPEFGDARIHFALNCGARSCPPLHNKAFRASSLNSTLDALTKTHLNHWRGLNEAKGKVHVTKLFDWFKKDFVKSGGSVEGFIKKYRTIPGSGKVNGYLHYDWTLNDVK